jgi:hypothetical protein
MKRCTDLFLLALGALLLSSIVACKNAELRPKVRPAAVPTSAIWAGGADGGAYFECTTDKYVNHCTIWNDYTGQFRKASFVLKKQNRPATSEELRYTGNDGKNIYLENGLVLRQADQGAD